MTGKCSLILVKCFNLKKKGAKNRPPINILLTTTFSGPISGTAILTNKKDDPQIEPIPRINTQSNKDILLFIF